MSWRRDRPPFRVIWFYAEQIQRWTSPKMQVLAQQMFATVVLSFNNGRRHIYTYLHGTICTNKHKHFQQIWTNLTTENSIINWQHKAWWIWILCWDLKCKCRIFWLTWWIMSELQNSLNYRFQIGHRVLNPSSRATSGHVMVVSSCRHRIVPSAGGHVRIVNIFRRHVGVTWW